MMLLVVNHLKHNHLMLRKIFGIRISKYIKNIDKNYTIELGKMWITSIQTNYKF